MHYPPIYGIINGTSLSIPTCARLFGVEPACVTVLYFDDTKDTGRRIAAMRSRLNTMLRWYRDRSAHHVIIILGCNRQTDGALVHEYGGTLNLVSLDGSGKPAYLIPDGDRRRELQVGDMRRTRL